jgi:DNA-binding Lrp family transcriptional regulator
MSAPLDTISRDLLDAIQAEFPLVERPFAELARKLRVTENDLIARTQALKDKTNGVIRQISAIFDSRALGYESSLVAAKIEPEKLETAVAAINAHPGVSHNYLRNHAYNLWYTVAVPPDSRLGLERTVNILNRQSGAKVTRLLPALKMFKIGVKFDLSGESEAARDEHSKVHQPAPKIDVTPRDKAMIRVLQQDVSIVDRPFDLWAQQTGCSVNELLDAARRYITSGVMRRFSAVLRHRAAGFGANAMGAWVVPPEKHEEFGAAAASFNAVSHCYLRPTYEDWPYSLYTMVHGKEAADCEAVLLEISRVTGIREYASLYSTHEYKKVRVKYFTPEIEGWESLATANF